MTENETTTTETDETTEKMPTYSEMFAEYVAAEDWIKPADPLVFHLRKLCAVLDKQLSNTGEATGPMNTAYLQALTRLDRKRPGASPGPSGGGELPGQSSIFDELDG